jgi:hypothetical protein
MRVDVAVGSARYFILDLLFHNGAAAHDAVVSTRSTGPDLVVNAEECAADEMLSNAVPKALSVSVRPPSGLSGLFA